MCCVPTDNPAQTSSVSVAVKVLDVNDNPPALSDYFDTHVCENAKAGQVRNRDALLTHGDDLVRTSSRVMEYMP